MGALRLVHLKRGPSSGQRQNVGPCRGERTVGGAHVPDGLGQLACHLDAGDLLAALLPEPLGCALVVLGVGGVSGGVGGRLDQCPAQVAGAVLGQRPAMVLAAGLVDPGTEAGSAHQLRR